MSTIKWVFPYQGSNQARKEVRKLALSLNLSQLVSCATRVPDVVSHTANCLGLLLTTDPDRFSVTVSAPPSTSDHCLLSIPEKLDMEYFIPCLDEASFSKAHQWFGTNFCRAETLKQSSGLFQPGLERTNLRILGR